MSREEALALVRAHWIGGAEWYLDETGAVYGEGVPGNDGDRFEAQPHWIVPIRSPTTKPSRSVGMLVLVQSRHVQPISWEE